MRDGSKSATIQQVTATSCSVAVDDAVTDGNISSGPKPTSALYPGTFPKKVGFWWNLIFFAPTCVFFVAFVVWYVHHERYVYFWDFVGFHNLYNGLGYRLETSLFRTLHYVWTSVRADDYNVLPVLFLLPIRLAFGTSRLAYILALTTVYIFPLLALFPLVVSQLAETGQAQTRNEKIALNALSTFVFASLPLLWTPVLLGSPDVGGLLIVYTALWLYCREDFAQQSVASLVSLGMLLGVVVLFRRWYAFWVVGFFGAMAVCEGLRLIREKERRRHFRRLVRNAFIVGEVAFLLVLIVATPIAIRMLTTNYGDIYSAYRSKRPIFHNLAMIYDHFGLLTLVFAAAGVVLSVWNPQRRPIAGFLCVQFAVTYFIFTRTQDFGFQHFYWALATIAIFVAWLARDVFMWIKSIGAKTALVTALVLLCAGGFAGTFVPAAHAWLRPAGVVFPQATRYPKVRTDLKSVQDLLDTLREVAAEPDSKIYILSSSFSLNSSMAHEACIQMNPPHRDLLPRILPTSDVDKRDGFPVGLLDAKYVVLTLPFGYHLAPEDQRVIGIPAEQIVRGEGIGASYDKLNYEFPLEDGSSAFIYKRARPLQLAALRALSATFMEFYPNHRDQFEIE